MRRWYNRCKGWGEGVGGLREYLGMFVMGGWEDFPRCLKLAAGNPFWGLKDFRPRLVLDGTILTGFYIEKN